jgi:hypothetical protein
MPPPLPLTYAKPAFQHTLTLLHLFTGDSFFLQCVVQRRHQESEKAAERWAYLHK